MPRNVRNFWISADVDGRNGRVTFGPRSKKGGFSLNIKMRNEDSIDPSEINIWGDVVETPDGEYLKLSIDEDNNEIYVKMTRRCSRGKVD